MREVLDDLAGTLAGGSVMVLSGAGVSTDSGIPDYRGPESAHRRVAPMTYQTFVGEPGAQQRYWARSHLGWPWFSAARPNPVHEAVAQLEQSGVVHGVVTQNVDGLHQAAGAVDVVDLHGRLDRVVCLHCGRRSPRGELHKRLAAANPAFGAALRVAGAARPDGDVELPASAVQRFVVVGCTACGGVLKPDVVFFGEFVPAERVEASYRLLERSRLLLVLGSSLTVMSGYRFVVRAEKLGIPVAIVNRGATRGDRQAAVKLDAGLGDVVPALAERVTRLDSPAVRRLGAALAH